MTDIVLIEPTTKYAEDIWAFRRDNEEILDCYKLTKMKLKQAY